MGGGVGWEGGWGLLTILVRLTSPPKMKLQPSLILETTPSFGSSKSLSSSSASADRKLGWCLRNRKPKYTSISTYFLT